MILQNVSDVVMWMCVVKRGTIAIKWKHVAPASIDSQHISSTLKLDVVFLTYSVALTMNHWNETLSLCLPGFAAHVFPQKIVVDYCHP